MVMRIGLRTVKQLSTAKSEHLCADCGRLFKECGEPSYFEECRHEDWGRFKPKNTESSFGAFPHMTGAELITKERQRQIEKEGWTSEHDADIHHSEGQLAVAAKCYLDLYHYHTHTYAAYYFNQARTAWPWDLKWFKPTPDDPIRELIKAGALIAAEIDRLQQPDRKIRQVHEYPEGI